LNAARSDAESTLRSLEDEIASRRMDIQTLSQEQSAMQSALNTMAAEEATKQGTITERSRWRP